MRHSPPYTAKPLTPILDITHTQVDPFPDGSAKAANLGPVSRAGWAAAVVGLPELAEKWAGRAAASQVCACLGACLHACAMSKCVPTSWMDVLPGREWLLPVHACVLQTVYSHLNRTFNQPLHLLCTKLLSCAGAIRIPCNTAPAVQSFSNFDTSWPSPTLIVQPHTSDSESESNKGRALGGLSNVQH